MVCINLSPYTFTLTHTHTHYPPPPTTHPTCSQAARSLSFRAGRAERLTAYSFPSNLCTTRNTRLKLPSPSKPTCLKHNLLVGVGGGACGWWKWGNVLHHYLLWQHHENTHTHKHTHTHKYAHTCPIHTQDIHAPIHIPKHRCRWYTSWQACCSSCCFIRWTIEKRVVVTWWGLHTHGAHNLLLLVLLLILLLLWVKAACRTWINVLCSIC